MFGMLATDALKQVKQKSKGDTAKAAPTDKHEAAQGSTKQKEEKKSHTTEASGSGHMDLVAGCRVFLMSSA